MSNDFIGHEVCPNCGGKITPPLGRWSDGHAYCFSCGYYEPGTVFKKLEHYKFQLEEPSENVLIVPPDMPSDRVPINSNYIEAEGGCANKARDWLMKYEITPEELRRYAFTYSPSRECIVMPVFNLFGQLQFWQSRNFNPNAISKYTTAGAKDYYDCVLGDREAETLVLVEDYLSAIKVARITTVSPLFGSEISIVKRTRMCRKNIKRLILWLDDDKWFDAQRWRQQNKIWFDDVICIKSGPDPKGLSTQEIQRKLQGIV